MVKIEEIKKMGNNELVVRYGHLNCILGSNNVYNNPIDDDLYMDTELMKNEIMLRMSRVAYDTTAFTETIK